MATIAEKRKRFMDKLVKVMDALDPSGTNSQYYIDKYSKMSDKEFDRTIRDFFSDEKANFYLEIVEYERDITYDGIEKAAKILGVPLYERVALPYINRDPDNIITTPEPVPVGYIFEKRMQQTLLHKNAGSTSISRRNPKTGQVTGADKNARDSDVETYAMLSLGAEKGLAELLGPRADNMVAKNQMESRIARDGYVKLEDLDNSTENKISLNTLDVYFTMMGFKTNLVYGGDGILAPKKKK